MNPLASLPKIFVPRKKAGFSLIEVCLALAIVATVFVVLIGLLPTGMKVFEDATVSSAQTRMVSHMVGMLQGADYTKFKNGSLNSALYYYDADGAYVDSSVREEAGSENRRVYAAKIVDSIQNIPNTSGTYDGVKTASKVLILMGRYDNLTCEKLKAVTTSAQTVEVLKPGSRVKVQPVLIARMDAE